MLPIDYRSPLNLLKAEKMTKKKLKTKTDIIKTGCITN